VRLPQSLIRRLPPPYHILGGLVLILTLSSSAWGAPITLLFDNFESYSSGTDIAGQGGWYPRDPSQAPILVSPGSYLGSMVLDGGIRTGDGSYTDRNIPSVLHSLSGPLNPSGTSTLSADAYAASSYRSHAAGLLFSSTDRTLEIGWWATWYAVSPIGPKWAFQVSGMGNLDWFYGGYDQPVNLQVVVDGSASEMFGRISHSGGLYETPHFAITPSQLASLPEVEIFEDYRDSFYLGAEYDNVQVTTDAGTVPEPSTLVIFSGLGVIGLVMSRRRRQRAA
jgi:hypothetical protein